MTRTRVLLVDDSAVVRRLLRGALDADAELEVVAEAANGREAIERIQADPPDAVICDVEMPVMSGIETVQEVRRRWPRLPVVMFASLTREAAHITLEALHAGANDFVTKPNATPGTSMAAVMDGLRHELGGKIKGLVHGPGDLSAVARAAVRYAAPEPVRDEAPPAAVPHPSPATPAGIAAPQRSPPTPAAIPVPHRSPPTPTAIPAVRPRPEPHPARPPSARPAPAALPPLPRPRVGACEGIVIGVSTGGPNALAALVPRLPRDLPVPVLIVQHMPPVFTRLLAERLAASAQLAVREAAHGDPVRAGEILLAPGDHHLTLRREGGALRCALNRDPTENSVRPAADVLFRSAAEVWGGRTLVVVMTGMGQDGLLGAMALHRLGATVLAQDEASSVVWGMPGAVSKAGIADRLVPLSALADEIAQRARGGMR